MIIFIKHFQFSSTPTHLKKAWLIVAGSSSQEQINRIAKYSSSKNEANDFISKRDFPKRSLLHQRSPMCLLPHGYSIQSNEVGERGERSLSLKITFLLQTVFRAAIRRWNERRGNNDFVSGREQMCFFSLPYFFPTIIIRFKVVQEGRNHCRGVDTEVKSFASVIRQRGGESENEAIIGAAPLREDERRKSS